MLERHLEELEKRVLASGEPLEGNCFYYHQSLTLFPELSSKQENLKEIAKGCETICEIGFNAGHSSLLFLDNNTSVKELLIFDLGEHRYMEPCFQYIKESFPSVSCLAVKGDSRITLLKTIELCKREILHHFDLVHVDGGHTESCFFTDFSLALLLCKKGGYLVVDDTNMDFINKHVDLCIHEGLVKEVRMRETHGYPHRIVQKI